MVKKILLLFFSLLVISSVVILPVFSEGNPEITPPPEVQSLANENGLNTICLLGNDVAEVEADEKLGSQTFNLVSGKAVPNIPLYVAVCLADGGKLNCTTSDVATDIAIFGADNTDLAFSFEKCNRRDECWTNSKTPSFAVTQGNPYTPTSNEVNISVFMTDIVRHAKYPFYGFQIVPPVTTGTEGVTEKNAEGKGPSQQQGTLTFEQLYEGVNEVSTEEECVGISWDPFGRVFDAKSLEPMSGVTVRILESISPERAPLILENEVTVGADGLFNFLVPPGTYYLRLSDLPSTHKFLINPNIHPNYTKIYVKSDGTSSIYKPDEPIDELIDTEEEIAAGKPTLEQRDIPLDPGNNPPYRATEVKKYEKEESMILLGSGNQARVRYSGRVSHPFAKVNLLGMLSNKLVGTTKADRNGFWQILIEPGMIPADEDLDAEAFPTDLIQNNFDSALSWIKKMVRRVIGFFNKGVFAAASTFQPILRYVEGYANGLHGPIPDADIAVRLSMNNSVYYKTKADAKGFFSIASNHLPPFNFYLEFIDPATKSSTSQTTSGFIQSNKKKFAAAGVDAMEYKPDKKNLLTNVTPAPGINDKPGNINIPGGPGAPSPITETPISSLNYSAVALILMIILLVVAVIGIVLYMKKRDQNYK